MDPNPEYDASDEIAMWIGRPSSARGHVVAVLGDEPPGV
jgi:hypothetical protein